MVEETIKTIKETENEAEEIVRKADAECTGILEEASAKAKEIKEQAEADAKAKAEASLKAAKEIGEKSTMEALADVEKEIASLREAAPVSYTHLEVYYNSRQFTHTLDALEEAYDSAFDLYDKLKEFYEEKGLGGIQHKRSARYAILLEFIVKSHPDREDYYRELLTYDYYLRENAKTRPEFAGEYKVSKEVLRHFYEEMCIRDSL